MKTSATNPPAGTIRDWIDYRADTTPNAVAYRFFGGESSLSWLDLRKRSRNLAARLTSCGVPKGHSVAIIQPNGPDVVIALFGALYGGFRATVINLAAGDEAIAYALDHCEANVAIVGDAQFDQFTRNAPTHLKRLGQDEGDADVALHDVSAKDDALLMYTSGTTGKPKGVVHSHASLLAGGWTPTIAHELTDADVGLCVLPICHINGLCVTVMGTLISGGQLAIAERFSTTNFWTQCDEADVTWFSVVPTIISHLLASEHEPKVHVRTNIRFGRSASSALAPDVQTAFETRFSVPIIETMGLTETSAQILSNPLPPGVRKIGSPGKAVGNEACILGPDFSPLGPFIQGEIAVRGPNVMQKYLKNNAATEAAFAPDGWLRTGDLGHMDEDDYVFVTGRLKELIIKGGENIAPREIDEALYSHSDVVEAAAFARPCKSYGERVEAAVRLRDGSTLSEDDLQSICQSKLGKFKSPDHIYFLPELPKGPSGKIQRLKLAEMIG